LMYHPKLGGDRADIWVPVANLVWGWSGCGFYESRANPKWDDGDQPITTNVPNTSSPARANSDFPDWKRNVKEARFVDVV